MEFSIQLIVFLVLMSVLKIMLARSNYLMFLMMIELIMLMSFMLLMLSSLITSSLSIFLLMCLMVAGACLGMSILVKISRSFSKEMEMFIMKM